MNIALGRNCGIQSCILFAVFCVVTAPLSAVRGQSDWPEFRGPTGQGLATTTNLALHWNNSDQFTWRQELAGKGWSSPVIYQKRIYLTTAVPDPNGAAGSQSLRALCLDARTGKAIWNVEVFRKSASEDDSIHAKNSYASPTPLVHADRLYVHFGPNGTAALDLDGGVVWKNQIRYDAQHGAGGSPIVSGQLLILNCDGVERPFVIALARDSGRERWRTDRPDIEPERFSFATPLEIEVNGQRQVVSPASSVVCSYAPETGREIWRVRYPRKWSIVPRPVFAHGLVYICTGYEGPAELLAIRPDGTGDVTDTHVVWRTDENVPHTPSPLVVGDELFMVSDNGIASCRDARSGKRHWRKRLGGNYSASPICAENRVYFSSEDGECIIVAAATEYSELARNNLDEQMLASLAVGDGALFIRTAEHLYRIDSQRETAN